MTKKKKNRKYQDGGLVQDAMSVGELPGQPIQFDYRFTPEPSFSYQPSGSFFDPSFRNPFVTIGGQEPIYNNISIGDFPMLPAPNFSLPNPNFGLPQIGAFTPPTVPAAPPMATDGTARPTVQMPTRSVDPAAYGRFFYETPEARGLDTTGLGSLAGTEYVPQSFLRGFAQGGLAKQADKVESAGRYGDTVLVHMNPAEVQIMNAMTPGGLTTNPQTGRPEAFAFLLPLIGSVFGPGMLASLGLSGLGATTLGAIGAGIGGVAQGLVEGESLGDSLIKGATGAALGAGIGSLAKAGLGAASTAASAAKGLESLPGVANVAGKEAVKKAVTEGGISALSEAGNAAFKENLAKGVLKGGIGNMRGAIGGLAQNFGTVGVPALAAAAPSLMTGIAGLAPTPRMPQARPREMGRIDFDSLTPEQRTQIAALSPDELAAYGISGGEAQFFTPMPGLRRFEQGGRIVVGKDPSVVDGVPAVIQQSGEPIRVDHGEFIVPRKEVAKYGGGDLEKGGKVLSQIFNTPVR